MLYLCTILYNGQLFTIRTILNYLNYLVQKVSKIMSKQPYRNAVKSKNSIKDAFLHLISNKDITQIRVREITDIANISKGTFYAHYSDIYNVLEDIENENIERLVSFLTENLHDSLIDDFTPFLSELFGYIQENEDIYDNLFKSNIAPVFLSKLQKVFVDYMMNDAKMVLKLKSNKEAKLYFSFIAVGTASLIHQHFLNPVEYELNDVINTLNDGILHGISSLLK